MSNKKILPENHPNKQQKKIMELFIQNAPKTVHIFILSTCIDSFEEKLNSFRK